VERRVILLTRLDLPPPSCAVSNNYKLFPPRAWRYSTSSTTIESNYSVQCSSGPASDAIIFPPFHLLLIRWSGLLWLTNRSETGFFGSISWTSDRHVVRLLFSPMNAPYGTLTSHYGWRAVNVLGAVMKLIATTTFVMAPNGRIVMKFYNCAFIELQYVHRLQILLKFDNNNGYFTWRCTYIHAIFFFFFFGDRLSSLCGT
jgi:hypothetical protein